MHPGAGCNNGTLANALAFHYPQLIQLPRCGIVHRLDKDTSGLLVIAKTEKFRNFFVEKLQNREIFKEYESETSSDDESSDDELFQNSKNIRKTKYKKIEKEDLLPE